MQQCLSPGALSKKAKAGDAYQARSLDAAAAKITQEIA
jgi:hypothetical protein